MLFYTGLGVAGNQQEHLHHGSFGLRQKRDGRLASAETAPVPELEDGLFERHQDQDHSGLDRGEPGNSEEEGADFSGPL